MSPAGILALTQAKAVKIAALAEISADGGIAGVDVSAYCGPALFILDAKNTAGTTPTLAAKLQHSSDNGSTDTWDDITDGGFTGLTDAAHDPQWILLNRNDLKKYVRVIYDIGGTSTPKYYASVTMIAQRQAPEPAA